APRVDGARARPSLGLSHDRPVILAMAGSHGALGRLHDVARVLGGLRRPLRGLLVAGRDESLRSALARLTDGTTIRTLGYVEDIRHLMAAADLLVTQARGMSVAE